MEAQPDLDLGRVALHPVRPGCVRDRRCRHALLGFGYLLSSEQTSTQAQLLFARALEDQQLLAVDGKPQTAVGENGLPVAIDDDGLPVLIAWSDNGAEMTAIDTRKFMALMAITQHHGRPDTPTDQAHIESFYSASQGRLAAPDHDPRPGRARHRARPRPA